MGLFTSGSLYLLLIKIHIQERYEASHKVCRKYRAVRSRHEDKKSKIDVCHSLQLDSHPRMRKYRPEKSTPAPREDNEDTRIIESMFLDWIVVWFTFDLLINCYCCRFLINFPNQISIMLSNPMKCKILIFFLFIGYIL